LALNQLEENSTLKIQHSNMEAIPSDSIDYALVEKINQSKGVVAI